MKKEQAIRSSVRRELGLLRPARASLRVLAISGFLWSLEAAAQAPYRQEILPGVSSLAIGETLSRPRAVDLDGDGDADLVAGDGAGKLHYFENVSAGAEPEFVGVPASSNPFAGIDVGDGLDPLLADLDFDGDLDLAAGNSLGAIRYFENTGGSAAPAFAEILGEDNPSPPFPLATVSSGSSWAISTAMGTSTSRSETSCTISATTRTPGASPRPPSSAAPAAPIRSPAPT